MNTLPRTVELHVELDKNGHQVLRGCIIHGRKDEGTYYDLLEAAGYEHGHGAPSIREQTDPIKFGVELTYRIGYTKMPDTVTKFSPQPDGSLVATEFTQTFILFP